MHLGTWGGFAFFKAQDSKATNTENESEYEVTIA